LSIHDSTQGWMKALILISANEASPGTKPPAGSTRLHQKTKALACLKTFEEPYGPFSSLGTILRRHGPRTTEARCRKTKRYTGRLQASENLHQLPLMDLTAARSSE
jgi:hypothetical protein